jgi:hypothetical protein
LRRVGVLRQLRDDSRDSVAHVARGRVDVAAHVELDSDLGALVLAVRFDLDDASMPEIESSMGCEILVSITGEDAPL